MLCVPRAGPSTPRVSADTSLQHPKIIADLADDQEQTRTFQNLDHAFRLVAELGHVVFSFAGHPARDACRRRLPVCEEQSAWFSRPPVTLASGVLGGEEVFVRGALATAGERYASAASMIMAADDSRLIHARQAISKHLEPEIVKIAPGRRQITAGCFDGVLQHIPRLLNA